MHSGCEVGRGPPAGQERRQRSCGIGVAPVLAGPVWASGWKDLAGPERHVGCAGDGSPGPAPSGCRTVVKGGEAAARGPLRAGGWRGRGSDAWTFRRGWLGKRGVRRARRARRRCAKGGARRRSRGTRAERRFAARGTGRARGAITLIAYLDNATRLIRAARFGPPEASLGTLREELGCPRLPVALDANWPCFSPRTPAGPGRRADTAQVGVEALDLEPVPGRRRSAPGRAEWPARTRQARLPGELRRRGNAGQNAAKACLLSAGANSNRRCGPASRDAEDIPGSSPLKAEALA